MLLGYRGAPPPTPSPCSTASGSPIADQDDRVEVEVPGYRVDIDREVDLIEEVARIEGYDRIGSKVPLGRPGGRRARGLPVPRARSATLWSRAGLREVRPLPFASADDLALTGDTDADRRRQSRSQADDAFLRTRLLPGLLRTVARNQARGASGPVALFEVGHGVPARARPRRGASEGGVARWRARRAKGGPATPRRSTCSTPRASLEALMDELAIADWSLGEARDGPFHPGSVRRRARGRGARRRAWARSTPGRAPSWSSRAGSRSPSWRCVRCSAASDRRSSRSATFPGSRPFDATSRSWWPSDVAAGDVQARAGGRRRRPAGDAACSSTSSEGGSLPAGTKSLAFSLEFRAPDRTLTGEETEPLVDAWWPRSPASERAPSG